MAMGVGGGEKGGVMMYLNVTPLIDVLLVLLIIFMVITPLTPKGLDALAPKPNKNQKENKEVLARTVIVSIDANDHIKINQDPVTLAQLGPRLEDIFKTRSEKVMFVNGDPSLPFQAVAQVIDIARGAGLEKIGLITKELQPQ